MRERVAVARQRAARRRPSASGVRNADLNAHELGQHCALDHAGAVLLERAVTRMNLSVRAVHRALRVARTIADLASEERVNASHLAEAFSFRAPALLSSCPNEQVDTRGRPT
jgi:magnesium chelatase family protein